MVWKLFGSLNTDSLLESQVVQKYNYKRSLQLNFISSSFLQDAVMATDLYIEVKSLVIASIIVMMSISKAQRASYILNCFILFT